MSESFTGEVHPVANMFPLLDTDELDALANDIAEQGQLHPIVIDLDGTLLDGRNRLAACKKAKVAPTFTTYEGDPVAYILGANLNRRDMTKGQKAMVVAACLETKQRDAAIVSGISNAYIGKAATVKKHAPDLVGSVIAGKLPLDEAYKTAQSNKAASNDAEALLTALQESDPDLAAKVAAEELTLSEAVTLAKRRAKEAEQRAVDQTKSFAQSVCRLSAILGVGTPDATIARLLSEWRPDAVQQVDTFNALSADGLHRVADLLHQTANEWETRNV